MGEGNSSLATRRAQVVDVTPGGSLGATLTLSSQQSRGWRNFLCTVTSSALRYDAWDSLAALSTCSTHQRAALRVTSTIVTKHPIRLKKVQKRMRLLAATAF